jgi:hypothetical protein
MAGICTRDAGAVVTQSKAIDRVSARSGCSGDFRGTVNYDRSGVSQRLAHHRLPPAGAAELHLHPRGATGKESLAAVDTTVLSLRRACPGTLLACRQELGSRATKFIPAIASPSGMSCRITPQ